MQLEQHRILSVTLEDDHDVKQLLSILDYVSRGESSVFSDTEADFAERFLFEYGDDYAA